VELGPPVARTGAHRGQRRSLRQAVRCYQHQPPQPQHLVKPGGVDDRFAGVPLVPMLRSILESNEILAEVYQHLPDQLRAEGRLFARVTALLRLSKETALDPNEDPSRLPIITRNVLRDPLGRLTPAAHGRLHTTAAALVDNAERAHHALLASAGTTAA